ncbi:MAG: hypothetical protein KDD01_06060 [Phaeodactylibacter sp.]|nr:hypothetical protein [Phaeodactylibacter sp.]MCB0614766.1 hypothetical protein [Phaeodactylibacter sp.]
MRIVLNFVTVALLLLGCSKFDNQLSSDNDLEALIAKEVKASFSENMGLVALTEIDEFQWDQLLILAPYSSLAEVETQTGVDLSSIRHFGIDQRKDIALMVFLDGGQPARAVAYPRSAGDFAEIEPFLIPRKLAVFQIVALPGGKVTLRRLGY